MMNGRARTEQIRIIAQLHLHPGTVVGHKSEGVVGGFFGGDVGDGEVVFVGVVGVDGVVLEDDEAVEQGCVAGEVGLNLDAVEKEVVMLTGDKLIIAVDRKSVV